jgi:hypothetical protein
VFKFRFISTDPRLQDKNVYQQQHKEPLSKWVCTVLHTYQPRSPISGLASIVSESDTAVVDRECNARREATAVWQLGLRSAQGRLHQGEVWSLLSNAVMIMVMIFIAIAIAFVLYSSYYCSCYYYDSSSYSSFFFFF